MKRFFLGAAAGLITIATIAQQIKPVKEKKSLLSFNAGISVPLICYAKTDISKNNFAGFAKMGFTLEVSYGYLLAKNIGITGKAFYSGNKTDLHVLQASGYDNYKYFGFMTGPLISAVLSSKTSADFQFTGGIARAFSPKMVYRNEILMNKDASTNFVWSAGADFRYDLSDKTFFVFKADHTQLKPKFNNHVPNESLKDEQHIVVMNFDAGFGIKF
jgi:Outer membrane protein beta-barrel domain